jgi:MHS family proline/betaine transporter-like MFS transporter
MLQQTSLTREQKEAVGLLSIGTFLEYFDLMLYVHMAALLNELFFPESDPATKSLFLAFTFCSTYLLRPIGALIFGWLGDNIGRKHTVMITTFMMATSCVVMAILPTYSEIGITASCIMIICRIIQGMTSMGEIIGAILYLTETIKRPQQYVVVALLNFLSSLGGTFALGVASLMTLQSGASTWRYAFLIGAVVALVGTVARRRLRETPDFADAKRRVKKSFEDLERDPKILEKNPMWTEAVNKTTTLAMFLVQCAWPVCFYIAFIHCGNILENNFGYTPEQVIHQNFFLSIVEIAAIIPLICLCRYFYPILILKIKLIAFVIFILTCPYLFSHATTSNDIFFIQSFIMLFVLDDVPATTIFVIYFPVFKRFTATAVTYALSRTVMFLITSFGLVYLIELYGHYGLLIIAIPITIGYTFGILHFEKLEKKSGNYPK